MRRNSAPLFSPVILLARRNGFARNVEGERAAGAGSGNHDRRGSALHTGNRFDALKSLARELRHGLCRLITLAGERRQHRHDVMGVEAGFYGTKAGERADQQRGGDEKYQRKGHFDRHQSFAREVLVTAGGRASAHLLQGESQAWTGDLKRRKEAKQDAAQKRNAERESKNSLVEERKRIAELSGITQARDTARDEKEKGANAQNSQQQAAETTDRRETSGRVGRCSPGPGRGGAAGGPYRRH